MSTVNSGKTHILKGFLVAILSISAGANASSLLMGKTITTSFLYPDAHTNGFESKPQTVTVGDNVEITAAPAGFHISGIDFTDKSIDITFPDGRSGAWRAAFNGLHFYDADGNLPAFTDVKLSTHNTSNWRVAYDANNIWLNAASSNFGGTDISVQLALETDGSAANAHMPIPAAIWLFAGGLLALLKFAWKPRVV